jgi:hypothetical protein
LSTGSTVYAGSNVLDKHCIDAGPMLDKKRSASKKALSAQLLLWICSTFSTVDPVFHAFWGSDAVDVDIQDMSAAVTHAFSASSMKPGRCPACMAVAVIFFGSVRLPCFL